MPYLWLRRVPISQNDSAKSSENCQETDASISRIRKAILYKGVLQEIHSDEIVVHLTDGQQNADIFKMNLPYAIEHSRKS